MRRFCEGPMETSHHIMAESMAICRIRCQVFGEHFKTPDTACCCECEFHKNLKAGWLRSSWVSTTDLSGRDALQYNIFFDFASKTTELLGLLLDRKHKHSERSKLLFYQLVAHVRIK